jgi:sortase A
LAGPRLPRVRAVLRFVASVMMVSGTLLIADAGVTLLWQEPVSAVVANQQQGKLKAAFFDPPRRVIRRQPLKGDAIARVDISAIGVSEYVVEGTDTDSLRKGPGHYPETPLPGEPGTTAIAGHRTTYGAPFRHIDELKPRERIIIDMPDGRFVYRVQQTKVVDDQDLSVLDEVGYQRLVLSACHPLYSAAERIIVFARFVRREPARVRRGS